MNQQLNRRPRRLNGIRTFLNAVEEQLCAVESGRLVLFGTRRHGFTQEEHHEGTNRNQTHEMQGRRNGERRG